MKVVAILIATCTIIAMLSFGMTLIASSATLVLLPKQTSSFSSIEITGKFSREALKDCYIIPGKGPPVKM